MDNIIKNYKVARRFRSANWWCYWNSKTLNKETRRHISWCYDGTYGCFSDSIFSFFLSQYVAPSWINALSKKGVMTAGKRQKGGIHPPLAIPLMVKVLWKRVTRPWKGFHSIGHMDKLFLDLLHFLRNIETLRYFNDKSTIIHKMFAKNCSLHVK